MTNATRQIAIEIRSVYGEMKAYPVCAFAKTFAEMLGTKTLTHSALQHIEKLGYEIVNISQFGDGKVSIAA